jgi:ribonuclease P protein component
MDRRYRLSRSQDFDAVYRKGRSVSTRFFVLHWFPRDESADPPRLGLAVPKSTGSAVRRNRIKRRLRELWADRLGVVPAGNDYVLVVREGLIEAAETQGSPWLAERVDDVLGKARA